MKVPVFIFFVFLLAPFSSFSQEGYNFYISNSGNDANSGTTIGAPKKTLSAAAPLLKNFATKNGNVSLGLEQGSVFKEILSPSYPLQVGTYYNNTNNKNFTIFNGADVFDTGWVKDLSTKNLFKQDITLSGFTGNGINEIGNYSFVYVTEIDKQLEITAPFTARKVLQFASRETQADSIPGSFYEEGTTDATSPITVFIHTSDGSSPNSNSKYRYEVTVRGRAIDASNNTSSFENLWVMGYGAGQGMLPGGSDSYYNKVIFGPGAAIHHVVIASGTIDHSLFLPGPKNTDGGTIVYYDVQGLGRTCYIQNTIFMDIPQAIYMHTSGVGSNYSALKLDNVIAFGDTTQGCALVNSLNNDTLTLNNVYTDGYGTVYSNWGPKYASITNCCFKDVVNGINLIDDSPLTVSMNNDFMRQHSGGAAIIMGTQTSLELSNSILHNNSGSFISGTGGGYNHVNATGNIFINNVGTNNYATVAFTNTANGIGTSTDHWDNNVYILVSGKAMYWGVTNPATVSSGNPSQISFSEWQRQSGQDKNSLFFDLRNDPRGLKAIFIDPANGDYELANTPEADQIRALKAGMTVPLTCFLSRPTYEEAAAIISNNEVLTANSCTNPCVQGTIRGGNYLYDQILGKGIVQLQWTNTAQQNIDHFEIERSSFFNSDYETIASIPVSNQSSYSFIDNNIPEDGIYNYRLVVVENNGEECYSYNNTVTVDATVINQSISIFPNPSSGKVNVKLNHFNGVVNLSVLNNTGQKILDKQVNVANNLQVPLDVSKQPSGSYWIKILASDGTVDVEPFILR